MSTGDAAHLDFDPPSGFSFEPEFLGHPPRTIPDELDQGPHALRLRARIVGLATAGVLCLVVSRAPGIDVLAQYLLPLAYLQWIGLGCFALAGIALIERARRMGPFAYVRDGMPLVARVLELQKAVSAIVNGAPSTYALHARVALRHPETGEMLTATLKSNDFSAATKDRYDAPFRVGDYVTAVFLPGRFEKSLRLYAFLDLNPRLSLHRGAPEGESPWKAALLVTVFAGFFLALVGNVYAFGRYQPLDLAYSSAWLPMTLGGLVLGGGMLAALCLNHRNERTKAAERARAARARGGAVEAPAPFLGTGAYRWLVGTMLLLGAPLLGALTAVCWCFMANAWLDTSAARTLPARVEAMTQTTHVFLIREYQIEFSLAGSEEKHKLLTTPEELNRFRSERAVARVREGRFGWPWVESVLPAEP
jgi:hypothetical protein